MSTSDKSQTVDSAKILAIGDIHLGAGCSGLPDDVFSLGINPEELTPAAALNSSIDFAIEQKVDAVLFAGNVLEKTDDWFPAIMPFNYGVSRLKEAGIHVIALAANMHKDASPWLSSKTNGFTLLGVGGEWQSQIITKNQQPVAEIIGCSFGKRMLRRGPLAKLMRKPLKPVSSKIPRIGLLHTYLDASGENYTPSSQIDLDKIGYDVWLLDYHHKPTLQNSLNSGAAMPTGSLGSLIGLDASQTGPRGPWLITISRHGDLKFEHVPLAPVRWEEISVSLDRVKFAEGLDEIILIDAWSELKDFEKLHKHEAYGAVPRVLGVHAILEGNCIRQHEISQGISNGRWVEQVVGQAQNVGENVVFVDTIVDRLNW